MSVRLKILDWLFTRAIGPFEFWTGSYSLVTGFAYFTGQSAIQIISSNMSMSLFGADLQMLGLILMFGGTVQLVALLVISHIHLELSRVLRWVGSVSEGSVWALCATFAWLTTYPIHAFRYLFTLLFMQELWVVMSLAYRGFRGKGTY